VSGTATSESVTVPTAVSGGDVMVLTATGVTTSPLAAPPGWTLAGTQPSSVMTTSVWTKVASPSDAGGSVPVTFPAAVKGTVQLAAYSGVDPATPVAAFSGAATHVTATKATTPTVTVPADGDWLVSGWAVKSSAVTAWTAPGGTSRRDAQFGSGGGRISSLVTDGGGPAAAGPAGGLAATTDQAFSASDTTSLVLAAACGGGGCAPSPPTASFTASCTNLSCHFDGSGSTALGSSITGYAWNFGDGATDSGATTDHTYGAANAYNVTLTVTNADGLTDADTQQVTATNPPPPSISFVAATGVTRNATSEAVTVPSTVQAGNAMILVATGVTTAALPTPAGWTLVKSQANPVMTTSIWSRVATSADANSTVTVNYPAQVKGSLQLSAYSGTSATNPVAAATGAATHVTASSATTPAVTVPGPGDWLLSYWTVKSSAVTSVTSGAASARNLAVGSGGGQVTSLLADSAAAVPTGPAGGLAGSANQPFSASTTLSVALAPGP
jgi:predicted CxxxxCH...CXXCH cytochrome family protein